MPLKTTTGKLQHQIIAKNVDRGRTLTTTTAIQYNEKLSKKKKINKCNKKNINAFQTQSKFLSLQTN